MKNILMILLIVLLGGGVLAASAGEYVVYLPIIYDDSADPQPTPKPTHTNTPKPPTPAPTPTPTPVYTGAGYTWVYIGGAEVVGGDTLVLGIKPGHCYDIIVDHYESSGTVAVLKALEIQDGAWWCTAPPYNPDAPWPPPQYPVPPSLPPEFGYGAAYYFTIPRNVKIVCGFDGQTNCKVVLR